MLGVIVILSKDKRHVLLKNYEHDLETRFPNLELKQGEALEEAACKFVESEFGLTGIKPRKACNIVVTDWEQNTAYYKESKSICVLYAITDLNTDTYIPEAYYWEDCYSEHIIVDELGSSDIFYLMSAKRVMCERGGV